MDGRIRRARNRMLALALACSSLLAPGAAHAQAAALPVFSDTGPSADAYGASRGYPVPPRDHPLDVIPQELMVGLFSHFDLVRPLIAVPRAGPASPLKRAASEIAPVYGYNGRIKSVADYLNDHPVTGLLIARTDTILYEHYQYARKDQDRFMSQSLAKTVTGLLVGIAVTEGAIRSIDDQAATYVPELAGTEYGATPIRALLQMTSGIAFRETYQAGDDITKLMDTLVRPGSNGTVASIRQFDTRAAPPGLRFNYSSADTEVLGLIVSRAVRMPLAQYLSSRIWQKLGAEADAAWRADTQGQELAFCCMVATLRDWARLGLMLANYGQWNGQQIVPRQWIIDSTRVDPRAPFLAPGKLHPILGYGYQFWLSAGERHLFSLIGIHGQTMLIDPVSKLVLVHTAVRPNAIGDATGVELAALWYAVIAQFGS